MWVWGGGWGKNNFENDRDLYGQTDLGIPRGCLKWPI